MNEVKIGFPIEYEDENNIVRNGLFLREPEIKELKKRLKEINRIIDLKQQVKKQKEVIDKAIDKLYCWGEALDPTFQQDSLDILKEVSE